MFLENKFQILEISVNFSLAEGKNLSNNNINLLVNDMSCYKDTEFVDYVTPNNIEERINIVVSHMYQQYKEYVSATINTSRVFENMLVELIHITGCLKKALEDKGMSPSQVFCEIDADRSVGILNILWHSISFTTRGNTKPQALHREDSSPLFTGRIIALNGDFQDAALEIQDQEYPDILRCEVASMYIPHDSSLPAIVKIKHLPDKELYFDLHEAPKQFLLKIIEIICGGGIYHEVDPDLEQ